MAHLIINNLSAIAIELGKKIKAWAAWCLAVTRWLAIKVATLLRWASVVVIAVGMGVAVVHYADEGMAQSLIMYSVVPGAIGFFAAHVLDSFGRRQDVD